MGYWYEQAMGTIEYGERLGELRELRRSLLDGPHYGKSACSTCSTRSTCTLLDKGVSRSR